MTIIKNDEGRINTLTDEECLTEALTYLQNRVQVGVSFGQDKDSGLITHSIITLRCGEYATDSAPEELPIPFMLPDISRDTNITVN